MIEVEGAEREQVIRWMEESRNVLGVIIKLLNDFDRLNGLLRTAENGHQRLQTMLSEFQRVSALAHALQGECEQLRKEVSRLQAAHATSKRNGKRLLNGSLR